MLHHNKVLTALAMILLLSFVSGCDVMSQFGYKVTEVRTQTIPYVSNTAIKISTHNGYIEVIADPSRLDVELVANVKASGYSMEEAEARLQEILIRVESKDRGNNSPVLNISVEYPDNKRHNNEGCSFTLRIPAVNGSDLDTANGNIKIAGLSGHAEIHTSNGKITVTDHNGTVTARTSNGAIVAENIQSDLNVRTSNGRVNVIKARGYASVTTSNGAISYSGLPGFDLQTSNGSIRIEISSEDLAGISNIDTQVSNGSINVNGSADISVSGTKNHKVVSIGGSSSSGGSTSFVRTSNGSVTIKVID